MGMASPEIIEDMPMKIAAFSRGQAKVPDADAIRLRHEDAPNTGVETVGFDVVLKLLRPVRARAFHLGHSLPPFKR
jgi:hypothetical protein